MNISFRHSVLLGAVLPAVTFAAAPNFTLYDTCGQPVSIEAYRGSIVWLTFGSTW